MKTTFLISTCAALFATNTLAGNLDQATPTPAIAPPVMAAPAVTDWSGAYVGLSYNSVSGTTETVNPAFGPFDLIDEDSAGFFGGYNWQRGNLVYGGELNYTSHGDGLVLFPAESLGDVIELRGRGGYAFGDALAYAFLGYGMSDYTIGANNWDISGITYGIGMDYMITDSMFAGLEFSHRELTGGTVNPGQDQTGKIDVISLRVGYKF